MCDLSAKMARSAENPLKAVPDTTDPRKLLDDCELLGSAE